MRDAILWSGCIAFNALMFFGVIYNLRIALRKRSAALQPNTTGEVEGMSVEKLACNVLEAIESSMRQYVHLKTEPTRKVVGDWADELKTVSDALKTVSADRAKEPTP